MTMHDRRAATKARPSRTLRERARPAVHPLRLPPDVAVWEAAGGPVPLTETLGAARAPTGGRGPGLVLVHHLALGAARTSTRWTIPGAAPVHHLVPAAR
ncbi:hypothetical protein ACIP79_03025 [Streptomyces sp. NPDC088747]|uniref:hypothetical protein n=1 Tax=Streptomyces sp. NPDC088747 TaxID=3365886 RepID=UPI003813F252